MNPSFNEKLIAYAALISGLLVSSVAVYYSVAGLTAIFSAAVIPIMIMGVSLEVSKIIATIWLKQNWNSAPIIIKTYLGIAVLLLMLITSMGIFGFLSKAHSDQSLVSGEVQGKIAIYDEKIRVERDNIDTNRKTLTQMDNAVDQVMSRSSDEQGANRAVNIRRSQQAERARLLKEINNSQAHIASLNDERAPIAAEIRRVDAEVGPIKYIAAFVYGDTDQTILEKAVTWVILLIIVVFDPLALILLLSSQISFQKFREQQQEPLPSSEPIGEALPDEEEQIHDGFTATQSAEIIPEAFELVEEDTQPVYEIFSKEDIIKIKELIKNVEVSANEAVEEPREETYIQNEEQTVSNLWSTSTSTITQEEYLAKSQAVKGNQ
jgi:hypothetical protein